MQPDSYHFHMLVYRQITHSNPLTSLFILGSILPFIILSTLYPDRSIANIAIASCFILNYIAIYKYLYNKDHQSKR
jgi:hypothetical protein